MRVNNAKADDTGDLYIMDDASPLTAAEEAYLMDLMGEDGASAVDRVAPRYDAGIDDDSIATNHKSEEHLAADAISSRSVTPTPDNTDGLMTPKTEHGMSAISRSSTPTPSDENENPILTPSTTRSTSPWGIERGNPFGSSSNNTGFQAGSINLPSCRYDQVTMSDDGISYKQGGETKFIPGKGGRGFLEGGTQIGQMNGMHGVHFNGGSMSGRNVANTQFSSSSSFTSRSNDGRSFANTTFSAANGTSTGSENAPASTFKNQTLSDRTFAKGSSLIESTVSNCTGSSLTLHGCSFSNCHFPNATVTNCSFSNSHLPNGLVKGCTFSNSNVAGGSVKTSTHSNSTVS